MTRFASLILSSALLTLIGCGESHDGADAGHDAGIEETCAHLLATGAI